MGTTNNPSKFTYNGEEYISIYHVESTKNNVEIELGFTTGLRWIRKRGTNFSTLTTKSDVDEAFSWLVLLELDYKGFYTSLQKNIFSIEGYLQTQRINSVTIANSFPALNIIICGLKTMTSNWSNLALDWLSEYLAEKENVNTNTKEYLDKIVNNNNIAQNVRHKAKRILKHFE